MDGTAVTIDVQQLKSRAMDFINVVTQVELENAAAKKSIESMEQTIRELANANKQNSEALDIATHAIEILRQVSDEAVSEAYKFLQSSLNSALSRMFVNTTRKIEINEYIRNNQYPQLELILHVGNGKTRSLKTDSGHGLAQIVSLLSILSLIVITGSRRILVMDEVISGLSVHNRKIVSDILWSFTEIGFQFIVNDHGFIPKGSMVYHLQMNGDVSTVKNSYIAGKGVYLQGDGDKEYTYENQTDTDTNEDDEVEIATTEGEQQSITSSAEVSEINVNEASSSLGSNIVSI